MTIRSEKLNSSSQDGDEISLKELVLLVRRWIHYLWTKKWLIFIAIAVGILLGLGYAYYKKPIFEATTTFVLEEGEVGGIGQYAGMAAMVGIDMGGGGGLFQGENILELYKSRTMLQKALLSPADFDGRRQLLIDRYLEFNKIRERWERPELKALSFADTSRFTGLQDSILGEIVSQIRTNNIAVGKLDKKLNILKVEVKAADQQFAKEFNDKIVLTVNNFYIETKTKKSLQNVQILQNQTDSVRAVMNGAIYSSARTVDATPNLNPARQVLRAPAQRSQFNAETNRAMLTELLKNLELSKMSLRKETPLIQVVDQPIYPLTKHEFGKLKGAFFGGIIWGFMAILFLIIRKNYLEILNGK
ncbi:Wzz/FepE/Etk N-terminal domain-containing protein [Paradesertivirga mongoliensis]|uniref:Wzz/FepE/Etk N-terminal domain-containing protein n=1 Tax=Paradesertivirga mongoliensis TaxID=2100740 RepID=A0ABW4ZIK6_9SPHI|nr:Wzz/FepE/Etk N-terminal domain-containing protein [Pedobacter mongoliensis]